MDNTPVDNTPDLVMGRLQGKHIETCSECGNLFIDEKEEKAKWIRLPSGLHAITFLPVCSQCYSFERNLWENDPVSGD